MKFRLPPFKSLILFIALLFVSVQGTAFAQLSITIDTLDTSQFPQLRIVFRVFDGGYAAKGLDESNFTVFENGVIQGPIQGGCEDSLFFTPSSIMMLLDRSGSIQADFPLVRQAAKDFVNQSSTDDEFAIYSFGGTGIDDFCPTKDISFESDWTKSKPSLITALDNIDDPCGGTPLRETIIISCNRFVNRTQQRIMVVLTDGDDSYNNFLPSQVISAARAQGVKVYTIGLGNDVNTQELSTLASQTGGKFYLAPTSEELGDIYNDISRQLAPTGNCELTYTTLLDCFDGSTVTIDLQVRSGSRTATASASFQLPYDTTTFTYVDLAALRNYVVEAGEEITFPITLKRVSTNRTSNNYEIDISYDKSLMELVQVLPTDVTAGYNATFQNTPTGATIRLVGSQAVTDTGEVALLVFKAFASTESSKSEVGISTPRTGTTCTVASANNGLITINGFCRRTLFRVDEQQMETRILPNSPNPFNPGTTVAYIVGKEGKTTLKVYDAIGRELRILVNDELPIGEYSAYFDGTGLSAGVYYLQLENNGDTAVRRMVMLK